MSNSSKLLERIKAEGIAPTPKWYFISKQWTVWIVFIISILFGALSFSVILYSIQQTDFVLLSHLSHSIAEFLLGIMPFFWLIGLFLFLGFALYSIQYSKKAYKLSIARIVGISTAMSILLGTIFFIGGGAGKLEKTFASNLSIYEGLEKKKSKIWNNPSEGLLSGTILSMSDTEFTLTDLNKNHWSILYKSAWIAPIITIKPGSKIKMIGKIKSDGIFIAEEIRPWGGRGSRIFRQ